MPAAKWSWFLKAMAAGRMEAFDPNTGVPSWWSLKPADTLGLVFWTKDPTNLIKDRALFDGYTVKIHVTATGWHEVEKGAPSIYHSRELLKKSVEAFGKENVTWRFSPVPVLDAEEVADRFLTIADAAHQAGLQRALVSFLQTNDLMTDPRTADERLNLLSKIAAKAYKRFGIDILLCNEDRSFEGRTDLPPYGLRSGICADPADYGMVRTTSEGCGCVQMADPFTINESCTMGCSYCYAADKTLTVKKRNTTRTLPVLR